ncbi:MAG TPA: cation:proton antiporter, partial [Ferruginibacter sp.]|nr:cation:proton antiporter [Ferruginibacter sp.]
MSTSLIIIIIGLFIFIGHYFSGVFERRSIPDVLGLILIGLLLGPVFKFVNPADFGKFGPIFSNLVLIFILFESGTDLKIDEIKTSFKDTAGITFFGFLSTAIVLGALTWIVFDLHWLSCLFLGTALGGTSSAVVVGLARKLPIKAKTTTTLILESAETDLFTLAIPISILSVMLTGENITANTVISQFFVALIMALVIGVGGAFLWSFIVNKLPHLKNTKFSTPAFLFILYGLAEYLKFSGPLTALSFGIAIGNLKYFEPKIIERIIPNQNIVLPPGEKDFFAELIFLLRTFFFLFIGMSIQIERIDWLVWSAVFTAVLIIVRIIVVKFVISKNEPLMDKAAISIMIPKGLGAAVVATLPMQSGLPDGF